jgi:hypothetical protein
MKKILRLLIALIARRLRSMDLNARTYWVGLLMLFIGLSWFASLALALMVVGGGMAVESVITSYVAARVDVDMASIDKVRK